MPNQIVEPILLDTYLAVIKNNVGSNMFRNFYAKVNSKRQDIMRNGDLSCAFFASSILSLFKLGGAVHGTVEGTVRDLEESGWVKIKSPKPGAVLVWEPVEDKGESHRHIGFYIGQNKAVSNNSKTGKPFTYHWTYGSKGGKPVRKIEAIYWHEKLGK